MRQEEQQKESGGNFHLSKWFLDFTGENGETMIFYAAKLFWRGWPVSYASWLQHDPISGTGSKFRFSQVQIPEIKDKLITWNDTRFGVAGTWETLSKPIQARIYNSEEGFLDWKCYQPASKVQLRINHRVLEGSGYAEQVILTVLPWKIPMDELRWGHFGSDENNLVWIELREKEKRQWLWLNGEQIENGIVEDNQITIPGRNLVLNLDRGIVLEAEKKISSVVGKLIRYLPGFKKVMPISFLMADECKWLSKGLLQIPGKSPSNGTAIHELVNFKAH